MSSPMTLPNDEGATPPCAVQCSAVKPYSHSCLLATTDLFSSPNICIFQHITETKPYNLPTVIIRNESSPTVCTDAVSLCC